MLRPASIAAASSDLAAAHSAGRRVRIGDDLDTSALNRVLEHEPGDFTCTVEAGITLSALDAVLAKHRQRLALDPPGDPTVGTCLAASLSGPLRHRFGTPRDLTLGVTLVLADGTVANAGGKVVKNVAGYDLGKLVCGSHGTLALIARACLRLHPVPEATASLIVETDDVAGAVVTILDSQLEPSALDVLHPGRVAALFEGGRAGVAAQLARAKSLVGGEETSADVWAESRERQHAARGILRFSPGELATVLTGLEEAILRPASGVAYLPYEVDSDLSPGARMLNRAVKEHFDPEGILV